MKQTGCGRAEVRAALESIRDTTTDLIGGNLIPFFRSNLCTCGVPMLLPIRAPILAPVTDCSSEQSFARQSVSRRFVQGVRRQPPPMPLAGSWRRDT